MIDNFELMSLPFFISFTSSSMTMAGSAVTIVKSCVVSSSRLGDVPTARGAVTSLRFGPRKRRMMTVHATIAPRH